jgi:hypothetical protein
VRTREERRMKIVFKECSFKYFGPVEIPIAIVTDINSLFREKVGIVERLKRLIWSIRMRMIKGRSTVTLHSDCPRPGDGFRELKWREKVEYGDELLHALWGWISVPDWLVGKERRAIVVRRNRNE